MYISGAFCRHRRRFEILIGSYRQRSLMSPVPSRLGAMCADAAAGQLGISTSTDAAALHRRLSRFNDLFINPS
jgi:hypothetical protein